MLRGPVHSANMKCLPVVAACLVLLMYPSGSLAHGDWTPKHGGVLNDGETTFEFVLRSGELIIYLSDHDEPLPTEGAMGRLEVTRGDRVVTYTLEPLSGSRLTGKIGAAWETGDKVMARVVMGDGSIRVGRIKIR